MYTAADFPTYTLDLKAERKKGSICWFFSGPWSAIDNFALIPVRYDGRLWPTSEHAFAAMKAPMKSMQERIRHCATPGQAKALGRRIKMRKDWEEVKFDYMWDILCAKFSQSEVARSVLESSKGRHLAEGNVWDDRIWGMTADPAANFTNNSGKITGQNALGKMLMAVRDRL